jgi:very-short-patch-repair endonuclease
MNESPQFDALVTGLLKHLKKSQEFTGRDPLRLPFPGEQGIVPFKLAAKFPDLDAAFGATISVSLKSEYSARIDDLEAALFLCESPIEVRFLLALICSCAFNDLTIWILNDEELPMYSSSGGGHGDMLLHVRPQLEIGHHRVDFAIELTFTETFHQLAKMMGDEPPKYLQEHVSVKLAVECDGHAFHEKTPEQAKRDKSRDRDLLNNGFPVMRFTGAEIFADPLKCADQVVRDFFEINKPMEE